MCKPLNTILARQLRLVSCLASAMFVNAACTEAESTATISDSATVEVDEWRQPDPLNLLYMTLDSGTVVIELAPLFAPKNVANITTLVKERYFDGLAIIRSQDNYVVQWADPTEEGDVAKSLGTAAVTIEPEFQRAREGVKLQTVDSRDAYADIVGFANGFPAAADSEKIWLAHCYGTVGVARSNELDSGNGTSLYVITGHAPRHLDRNITIAGRVIYGIEHLSALPRGGGPMGFYESPEEYTNIVSIRLGSDIADADQVRLEVMRTDSAAFSDYIKARTYREEEWFVEPTGRIELCNLNPPVRLMD